MGKEQNDGSQPEKKFSWMPMVKEAQRSRQEAYATDPFSKKDSMSEDWSEEVLSRVRGELPAPSSASSATTTGETSAS